MKGDNTQIRIMGGITFQGVIIQISIHITPIIVTIQNFLGKMILLPILSYLSLHNLNNSSQIKGLHPTHTNLLIGDL